MKWLKKTTLFDTNFGILSEKKLKKFKYLIKLLIKKNWKHFNFVWAKWIFKMCIKVFIAGLNNFLKSSPEKLELYDWKSLGKSVCEDFLGFPKKFKIFNVKTVILKIQKPFHKVQFCPLLMFAWYHLLQQLFSIHYIT
jgi:hypothetical protein